LPRFWRLAVAHISSFAVEQQCLSLGETVTGEEKRSNSFLCFQ
jgi:hypothetical protein